MRNVNDSVCIFSSFYCLEKKTETGWTQIPYTTDQTMLMTDDGPYVIGNKAVAWTSEGYPVGNAEHYNEEWEMGVNWEWLYGVLDAGEYRIVKDTFIEGAPSTKYYVSAEFTLA
jgi:hypothetical protein